ncbi:MAG TPA: lipopolysaccharide biosynthesis protein [Acetobacteraceae bacterium]|jgi:O-antigen/teichoic acid export membrane protein|nr:lipopolysaccharide biosynthesis protein [Acetobacteraceae bacterium]
MTAYAVLMDRAFALLQRRFPTLRRHATRGTFTWNVSVMLTGTVAGQAISLLMTPLITRLFSPAQFGSLGVYNATLMTFGTIACLGLELAIPICMVDGEYANLLALCGIVLAFVTALVGLASWLTPAHMLAAVSLGSLADDRWLLPVGLAFLGGYSIVVAAATRSGSFREIASTRISQGISGPASQVLLGLVGAGTPGLIGGYVIGQTSGTALLVLHLLRRQRDLLLGVTWRGIAAVARRYAGFPLLASWARLLDLANGMVVNALFASFYSSNVVGFMFLSYRVLMRPLSLVSTSLLQVFTGEAGRAVSENPALLRRRFYQVVPRLFALATAWVLAGNLIAIWAFPVLFGNAWAEAIPYLQAMSVAGLLDAVLHPVSTTLQMLEYQWTAAIWQIGRVVAVALFIVLPWKAGYSAVATLWIDSGVEAVCCVILLLLMVWAIERTTARHRRES